VPSAPVPANTESESRFRTPADIINSRGFWGDTPPTKPKQATPAQVASLTARQALAAAVDPQSTASIDHAFHALAYAPVPSPLDRARIVAASAPVPRHLRPRTVVANPMSVNDVTTVVAKGHQGRSSGRVAVSTRLTAAGKADTVWMRAMILAPSATTAMSSTTFGDPDMTTMRIHFVKPRTTLAAGFAADPQAGLICDRFTGSAVATLPTVAFQTAALH
ncbi:MAG: ATP-binding protein, partial [Xanthobacteraceae bacterium]